MVTKSWDLQVRLQERDGVVRAEAVLRTDSGRELRHEGTARPQPHNPSSPELAEDIAVFRALTGLAYDLLDRSPTVSPRGTTHRRARPSARIPSAPPRRRTPAGRLPCTPSGAAGDGGGTYPELTLVLASTRKPSLRTGDGVRPERQLGCGSARRACPAVLTRSSSRSSP
ncbi:dsRBD fold-containing protein [Nocardioides astragali]|uniref:DsRBD fold-containing protein n=2 Tax=Nocardioides astragali TaxID=1776736 RepID=A0ABW2N7P1_9ACTN